MYFIGLDLAWGETNQTGIAVLDEDGALIRLRSARADDRIIEAVQPYVVGPCLVGVDAPLIVTNPTGRRACEASLNRDFARFHAGAHPTNTGRPQFANTPRGARLANALGLDMDPRSRSDRRAIEVYPHPATIALFGLSTTLKYKHKRGRGFGQLRSELLELMRRLESLEEAPVRMGVRRNPAWVELRQAVAGATRKFELRRREDEVDAVLCAYIALYAQRRPDDVTVYGDYAGGYIVTPTLAGRAARPDG